MWLAWSAFSCPAGDLHWGRRAVAPPLRVHGRALHPLRAGPSRCRPHVVLAIAPGDADGDCVSHPENITVGGVFDEEFPAVGAVYDGGDDGGIFLDDEPLLDPVEKDHDVSPTAGPQLNDPDWMFFDVAKVFVQGGAGGNGCVAFRRERGIPKGGPAGGNGGRGGSVTLVADEGTNTLGQFRGRVHFRASPGKNGINKSKHGEAGADMEVRVPVGTLVRNEEGRVLADMVVPGERVVVAPGGRGGRGNAAFKTPRNNAPRMAERGEKGGQHWLRLELKLVADVGLVGVPNAGKSTFLDRVSNARPKIADYPFTTVVPNLGVVDVTSDGGSGYDGMVVADIPGLLEGAHSGVGLGTAFLRHIERCRILVHVVSGDSADPAGDYEAIQQELQLFNPRLVDKPQVVLLNKIDIPEVAQKIPEIQETLLRKMTHRRIAAVSALKADGVSKVLYRLRSMLQSLPREEPDFALSVEADETARLNEAKERQVAVELEEEGDAARKLPRVWRLHCVALERAAQMTNWDYLEAIDRFQRMLEAMGASSKMKADGVRDGDFVRVGLHEFEYFANENIYTAMAVEDGYVD